MGLRDFLIMSGWFWLIGWSSLFIGVLVYLFIIPVFHRIGQRRCLKDIPYMFNVHRLTGEEARHAYKYGRFKDGKDCPVYVSEGFYAKKLTFDAWLNRYKVVIVD